MHLKKYCILILNLYCAVCFADNPRLLHFSCPYPNELIRTHLSGSWAKYHYTGKIYLDFPEENNIITLFGDANNADDTHKFYGATWTDSTFLCLYDFDSNPIVLAEGQLEPYVRLCYFGVPTPYKSECNANDPLSCIITCEMGSKD